jgi:hypothetical protein
LITSQYLSIVYYAAPVWITSLSSATWNRINSAHYRALRAAIGDHRKRVKKKRVDLDKECRRASPQEWAKYIIASTVIKLYDRSDTNIANVLRTSAYINDRNPYKAKFIDTSRLQIGRQSLPNRIGAIFSKITFDWVNQQLSDDAIRVRLKK